jgi:hypothetical protein
VKRVARSLVVRTLDGWRQIDLTTLTARVDSAVAKARRWRWVQWRVPGGVEKLALLTPLSPRIGLLEFTIRRRGVRGAWVRRLRVCDEKAGGGR